MLKPLKFLAIFIYIFLPVFERPSWCIKNPNLTNYYCNDANQTYANSNVPKINPLASNLTYMLCLAIMLAFTYARDRYRELENIYVRRTITVLTTIAMLDLIMVIIYDIALWNV